MNNTTTFAAVSTWISIAEAKELRSKLIAEGIDKKQVKLSSYRWVDIKDHSKGYMCRVLLEKGVRPELEQSEVKRGRKSQHSFATEQNTGNTYEEATTMTYFCRRNSIDETMTA